MKEKGKFKKILKWIVIFIIVAGGIGSIFDNDDDDKNEKKENQTEEIANNEKSKEEQERIEKEEQEKKEKEEQERIEQQKREQEEAEIEKAKAEGNYLSESDKLMYVDYSKDVINSLLKSPSTAKYPGSFFNPYKDWSIINENNIVTIKSYVDSQNSFGAMVRSDFVIKIKYGGGQSPHYLMFDGQVIINN